MALTFTSRAGLYGMGFAALAGMDVAATASALGASSMGPLIKLSVVTPLLFHFAGGVRHFVSAENDIEMCHWPCRLSSAQRTMSNEFV